MNTVAELMLAINDRYTNMYYHKDTNQFDYNYLSEIQLKHLSPNRLLPRKDLNNFRLPTFDEIDHKELMSFYVKQYVEDKEIRKQLFSILRRNEYVDAFIDKLHELNLYDDFIDGCGEVYVQIFKEWASDNGLDFRKK